MKYVVPVLTIGIILLAFGGCLKLVFGDDENEPRTPDGRY